MVQGIGAATVGLAMSTVAVSAGGVWAAIRISRRAGMMDIPNERSSHATPTPRTGGVPMTAAAVLAFACWSFLATGNLLFFNVVSYSVLFALGMSALGFLDDLSGLSPLLRFFVQMTGAVLFLFVGVGPMAGGSLAEGLAPAAIYIPACALWIVWMLNLYNFMDGIDGLAGGEAVVASSFFFLLFSRHGEPAWAAANLFVAAASMGFLVHNWPPARIFMGDAGSTFLGAFYGMQSVVAALTTPVPFLVLVLPFSNFILDTTATLVRRVRGREKWYEAHRSHYYQRLTNLGLSHGKVTALELLSVGVACLMAEGYLRLGPPGRYAVVAALLASAVPVGVWVSRRERKTGNDRGVAAL